MVTSATRYGSNNCSAAYLGALRSFVSPSGFWHSGVIPEICWVQVVYSSMPWCPEVPKHYQTEFTRRWDRPVCGRACTSPTQSSLSLSGLPVGSQLTARHVLQLLRLPVCTYRGGGASNFCPVQTKCWLYWSHFIGYFGETTWPVLKTFRPFLKTPNNPVVNFK